MKFEESIGNINVPGKQSIEIRFKPEVSAFYSMLVDNDLIIDTSDESEFIQMLADCMMIIDGQCCECDYFITTDEDDIHDFEVFKDVILGHGWHDSDEPPTNKKHAEDVLRRVWNTLKPFTYKVPVTWG